VCRLRHGGQRVWEGRTKIWFDHTGGCSGLFGVWGWVNWLRVLGDGKVRQEKGIGRGWK
jgi:hypothetical protein